MNAHWIEANADIPFLLSRLCCFRTCVAGIAVFAQVHHHHLGHGRPYFQAPQQEVLNPPFGGPSIGAAGVPQSLIDRVIRRESGGNPRAVSGGNYGLMQIRLSTARSMGYTGSAAGLLDPQTNMTYAVRYLAGAYRAAGGNEARALALYSRGYYYEAKRQGFSPYESDTARPSPAQ